MIKTLYLLGGLTMMAAVIAGLWIDIDYLLAARISMTVLTAAVISFTLLYGWRSAWCANRVGKAFFAKSVIFSIMLIEMTLAGWWDAYYPERSLVRYIIYTSSAIAYIGMLIALIQEQSRTKRLDDDEQKQEEFWS